MSRENTAVNRLIEMAHERPLEADDALFSEPRPSPRKTLPPPFRARVPSSTQTALPAAPQPPDPYVEDPVAPAPAPPIKRMPDAVDIPIDVDDPTPLPAPLPHLMHDMTGSWFERGLELEVQERSASVQRRRSSGRMRTALWLTVAFAAGLAATAIVAWPARSVVDAPAAPPAPAAAVAPAPAVTAPAPAAPQVVVVTPAPIVVVAPPAPAAAPPAPVSPAPVATPPAPAASSEPPAPAAAPPRVARSPSPPAAVRKAEKPAPRVEKRVARAEAVAPVTSGGSGVLALGSKPPCDIFIDGKNTGLTTPQRALKVPAGAHRITLVNREHQIKDSFSVNVKVGESTKVVKDLTRRMK